MASISSPTTNRRSLCHGLVWLKQGTLVWLVLFCGFLAGGSAGAFLFDPCRRLDGSDIESHQTMLTDGTGYQFGGEQKDAIDRFGFGRRFDPLTVDLDEAAQQANPYRRIALVYVLRANHAKGCAPDVKLISDSDIDLSVLIAQRHTQSRFKTAFVIRRLYIFQNQFTSIVLFSCLRDAGFVLKGTHFGSISCRSQLVLSTYMPWTLVWARQSSQAQNRQCAATATARSQARNLSPQHDGGSPLTI